MANLKIQKDNGEIEEFSKEDMTDQQRGLFDDILSLQKRCLELEPMAREFADKKQLVDFKSKLLQESLEGADNATQKNTNY